MDSKAGTRKDGKRRKRGSCGQPYSPNPDETRHIKYEDV